jgi:uncharacterized protein YciI
MESTMFLVTSTYTAPPEAIAASLAAHREWLAGLYENGIFFVSGRLVPPQGGFMMARGVSRDELDALLANDPFRIDRLLTHTVVELTPTRWAPALAFLAEDAA